MKTLFEKIVLMNLVICDFPTLTELLAFGTFFMHYIYVI